MTKTQPLPEHLRVILEALRVACAGGDGRFVYASEWLGYLPFGQYHWVDAGEVRGVESGFPPEWTRADLEALVARGLVRELSREAGPDEGELHIVFELTAD